LFIYNDRNSTTHNARWRHVRLARSWYPAIFDLLHDLQSVIYPYYKIPDQN